MKINYNVTGSKRKELTLAIGEVIGQVPVYAGMPTAAYHMVGGYTVSKTGEFTAQGEVEDEMNARIIARLAELGFNGEVEDGGASEVEAESVEQDGAETDGAVETETVDETDLNAADETKTDGAVEAETDGADCDTLAIEFPLEGFTPEKLDNLTKMINAKAALLKASLGTDELPIQQTEDALRFPWFKGNLDGEHTNAYSALIGLLCKTAQKKKRITAAEKQTAENPKYAMRCFLLSIGFIGEEYKTARRILLERLDGNSSWKNGRPNQNVEHAESQSANPSQSVHTAESGSAVSEGGECDE